MTDDTRRILSGAVALAGLGWCLGVEIWRGRSRSHSAWVFWLHLTSMPVAIAGLAIALALTLGSDRFWRHG